MPHDGLCASRLDFLCHQPMHLVSTTASSQQTTEWGECHAPYSAIVAELCEGLEAWHGEQHERPS
eukprot:CAMPEP_0115485028 /NCGR_PEP_ID=MMETSP0271-20121206/59696_1 /TAXON_ID=71861 /ORGANISM="Scrippsiella trochoidea, Strain CCMP3099" /LENGTH=64 /DNA_ID=CAMNT_0002912969 /DNA_START=130 /DNA_END=324 /DNA_ORIENTATION=+